MNKSQFFAILIDANNKIGVTAHIKAIDNTLIICQNGAPNTYLSSHRSETTMITTFTKYNKWLNEWFSIQTAHTEALIINSAIDENKHIATCKPLPKDSKLPKVKPFHVTFSYHHSMFGTGQAMANEGFSDLMFALSERDDLTAWEKENNAPRPTFHTFLDGKQKEAEEKIEKGLAIRRTAIYNLNQWGSGETGTPIHRNFEFLNPENLDFY